VFDIKTSPLPWSDRGQTRALTLELYICANSFQIVTSPSRVIERHLIQSYNNLELWPWSWSDLDQKYTLHIDTLFRFICKSHQGINKYKADTTVCLTLKHHLYLEVIVVKHALSHWNFTFVPTHSKMSPVLQELLSDTEYSPTITLKYDHDLEQTLTKNTHCTSIRCSELFVNPTRCESVWLSLFIHGLCTSSDGTLHVCQVISKHFKI